jgi:hypothetical protein
MKMNRILLKKSIPQILAWAGLAALTGVIALAQTTDSDSITVTAAATGQRSDGQIEMDVVHALDASKALKGDLITAATIQGEVTLSGTVSGEASSELAEAIAGHVEGVTKVNNNLKVGNPQAAQAAQHVAPGTQQMADSAGDDAMAPVPPPPPPDRASLSIRSRLSKRGRSMERPIRASLACNLRLRRMKRPRGLSLCRRERSCSCAPSRQWAPERPATANRFSSP